MHLRLDQLRRRHVGLVFRIARALADRPTVLLADVLRRGPGGRPGQAARLDPG